MAKSQKKKTQNKELTGQAMVGGFNPTITLFWERGGGAEGRNTTCALYKNVKRKSPQIMDSVHESTDQHPICLLNDDPTPNGP
jgi:hypothetical protein